MAKTEGPLLSEAAHGTVGKVLTYSTRKIVKQVRFQRKQADIITAARTTQRDKYIAGVAYWKTLTGIEKEQYNDEAVPLRITGFNLFMRNWLKGLIAVTYQLLLETGDQILQEDGYRINLE